MMIQRLIQIVFEFKISLQPMPYNLLNTSYPPSLPKQY